MFLRTFKGGIHPPQNKTNKSIHTVKSSIPDILIIPIQQHIGKPCEPIVKVGDKVLKYQKIAESRYDFSCPIHSPTSGTVRSIELRPHPLGMDVLAIIIETDKLDTSIPLIIPRFETKEEIISMIKEAGIVGMGGASFPTHLKLKTTQPITHLILNGCECEPILTCDHRLMIEEPDKIIEGLKIMLRATDAKYGIIAVEDNKPDAIRMLSKYETKQIKIVPLKTKYPQGAEKILIKSILGKKLPPSKYPADIGIIVQNIATAKAISDACKGIPLVERIVTVAGSITQPKNIRAHIGMTVKDLINECDGYSESPHKIIIGGPLMGIAQETIEVPIIKSSSGIIIMNKPQDTGTYSPCIRCGRCVTVCPMNLIPTLIAKCGENKQFGKAENYHVKDCFECGSCTYVCPANIPLVQLIKYVKSEINKK